MKDEVRYSKGCLYAVVKPAFILFLIFIYSCVPSTELLVSRTNYNIEFALEDMDVELFAQGIGPLHQSEWTITEQSDSIYQIKAGRRIEGSNYIFTFTEYSQDSVYVFTIERIHGKRKSSR
jgi:hypothetical protein